MPFNFVQVRDNRGCCWQTASAFADAISRLCPDRKLRMAMGTNGQSLVTKLSPRSVASSMCDLYEQFLDSTSNASIARAA